MKIEGENFYLLDSGEEKHVNNSQDEAVNKLKEISNETDTNPEDMAIYKVAPGEEWEIKQVPWSKIAVGLLGD